MEDLKKELKAFKKATRVEIKELKSGMDQLSKGMDQLGKGMNHLGKTMDSGFERLINALDHFTYMERDLENLEERVSKIEKKLDSK